MFGFLSAHGAIELLRAYALIEDEQMRRDVLALVRSVATLASGAQRPASGRTAEAAAHGESDAAPRKRRRSGSTAIRRQVSSAIRWKKLPVTGRRRCPAKPRSMSFRIRDAGKRLASAGGGDSSLA